MSKLLQDGIGWFRRSLNESDHENVRPAKSAPLANQGSLDSATAAQKGAAMSSGGQRHRSTSTSGVGSRPPPLISPNSLAERQTALDYQEDPELDVESTILVVPHDVKRLNQVFPNRLAGSATWRRVFATHTDGYSLKKVYREMESCAGPTLLLIEDSRGNRFGALTSTTLVQRDGAFHGTGESLLFRLGDRPEEQKDNEEEEEEEEVSPSGEDGNGFKCWKWTNENDCCLSCAPQEVIIGASDGKFGLTFDGDLHRGRTDSCATYGNEPLVEGKDFEIKTLEIWTFL